MMRFVRMHLLKYGPAFTIAIRQFLQVAFKVFRYLAFGFSQEPEIPFIAQCAGYRT